MQESIGRCGVLDGALGAIGEDLGETHPVLERFVQEYGERAYQFAFRLCGNVEQAKDLVQDSFCRLLRNWDSYDPSQALEGWFFAIMKNIYFDHCRSFEARNMVSLSDTLEGEKDEEGPGGRADRMDSGEEAVLELLERGEAAGLVREALATLTHEHRGILTLCDMEGLTYDEIARVTGVPTGTVRSRVFRAREALRRALSGGPLAQEVEQ
jgi:RNA polymerase sigma-70 factor (ECF subfamily)